MFWDLIQGFCPLAFAIDSQIVESAAMALGQNRLN